MRTAAILVAAGRGTRAGGIPKQWREVAGRTVAAWTLAAFRNATSIGPIVLVLHPDDLGLAAGFSAHGDVLVAEGGKTRSESVRNGLAALTDVSPDAVLIHDVARPLVSQDVIDRVTEALSDFAAAAPALAVTDALWRGESGEVTGTVDRTGLFRAQTPQGFRYPEIVAAHAAFNGDAADDVEVARAAGLAVRIVAGEETNMKITGPEDFARAEALLRARMDPRVGNGYDVHRFGDGDKVTLCGIDIPFERGLSGHSDADVAMHAVTDAIYGALAEGDIGQHFPPSDPRWKGAASEVFLTHAAERARDNGYRIAHVDCTIICEQPKIGPHASEMRLELARIIEIDESAVSVKATTSERLGFTGRGEGIAAQATALLVPA